MAIHDPESSTHERAIALKMGRQKRIQVGDLYLAEVEVEPEQYSLIFLINSFL